MLGHELVNYRSRKAIHCANSFTRTCRFSIANHNIDSDLFFSSAPSRAESNAAHLYFPEAKYLALSFCRKKLGDIKVSCRFHMLE